MENKAIALKRSFSTPHGSTATVLLLVCCCFGLAQNILAQRNSGYRSPSHIVTSIDKSRIYVSETEAESVTELELSTGRIIRRFKTRENPTGMALSPDGQSLYVTTGIDMGKLVVFDTVSGKRGKTYEVGHSPGAPVMSRDGDTIFVCNRFSNRISVFDIPSGSIRHIIPVKREPVSAVLTENGDYLLAVNHLPAGAANAEYVAASISVIDTRSLSRSKDIPLPNGSMGLRDITLSPDGKYAYVGHVLARYQVPATQLERGWINTNAVSVLDVEKMEHLNTFLLDDLDLGAPNPWGITISEDGDILFVVHNGSHEISLIERHALHNKLSAAPSGQVLNNLNFVSDIRKRVQLTGLGPRSCITAGTRLFVAQFFSDDIGVVDFANKDNPVASSLSLGSVKKMNEVRRGRFLFNDGSYCFQKWQSCTSCHPSERMDGLNWDLLNDGIGNPKNTKSLLYSHMTPPTTYTGVRPNAETSVRAGMRFMGAVLPESDAKAMDAFLKSMRPIPSPYLVNGKLSQAGKRGRDVFKKALCNKCHSGNYFTDLQQHDVGTGEDLEFDTAFDVPTLIEIWRTAPYLYDGRARTIRDVIVKENPDDKHGHTNNLSSQEIEDLITYVLSL